MSADIAPAARFPIGVAIQRVLVAADLSEASTGALRLGADIASAFGAELLLVHVLPEIDEPGSVKATLGMEPGDLLERRAGEAEGRLRRLESILGRGQARAHACVRCGSAVREIVRLAKEAGADLIVLGSHAPPALRGACAEPVAERVRARAGCPVVVALPLRVGVPPASSPDGASIHGVLVASDLTGRSEAAVRWGRALGERLGCPVHVLHVVGRRRRRPREAAGDRKPDIIRSGDPAEQIVSCARELGDDLIVLGTPRRGALHALNRGVGRAVVERAGLATLTAR